MAILDIQKQNAVHLYVTIAGFMVMYQGYAMPFMQGADQNRIVLKESKSEGAAKEIGTNAGRMAMMIGGLDTMIGGLVVIVEGLDMMIEDLDMMIEILDMIIETVVGMMKGGIVTIGMIGREPVIVDTMKGETSLMKIGTKTRDMRIRMLMRKSVIDINQGTTKGASTTAAIPGAP